MTFSGQKYLERILGEHRQKGLNDQDVVQFQEVKKQLDQLLDVEDSKWGQRAKMHWLKDGDRSTSFFHAKCSMRRRCNIYDCWVES